MFFPNTNDIDQTQNPPALPPNKPTSQRAATMPSEPDEASVSTLQEFIGIPGHLAVRYLKVRRKAYIIGRDKYKLY